VADELDRDNFLYRHCRDHGGNGRVTPELVSTAHHEAGHAVATVLAFRDAKWLPAPRPPMPVRYVEITENSPGEWTGNCQSRDIYSTKWGIDCVAEPYRPLMKRRS
jgi:hypothetical protein